MGIDFAASERPTLGVEWEFALVDKDTRDLSNTAAELFARVYDEEGTQDPKLHKELLRDTVEVVTGVCENVQEAIEDLQQTLAFVQKAGDELGVDLYCAGTHPFAQWSSQLLTPGHRYEELIARTQWWGRQMLIWGVHVHVGVRRREHVLPIISSLLNQFPHLQALSASSPIWAGTDTGYASNRAMMFQQLPTAGLPFQFERWEEFEAFVHDQKKTGVIDHINELRWDIRPSPHLGTVEVRVCDGIPTVRELRSIVALIHCLVVDLEERLEAGEALPTMPPWRAGEQVACGPVRPRRGDHPGRGVQRAAGHRRPRRPVDPAGAGGGAAGLCVGAGLGRGDPEAGCVVPASARGGRGHRR